MANNIYIDTPPASPSTHTIMNLAFNSGILLTATNTTSEGFSIGGSYTDYMDYSSMIAGTIYMDGNLVVDGSVSSKKNKIEVLDYMELEAKFPKIKEFHDKEGFKGLGKKQIEIVINLIEEADYEFISLLASGLFFIRKSRG